MGSRWRSREKEISLNSIIYIKFNKLTALNQEKKDDEVLYMKFVKSFEKD